MTPRRRIVPVWRPHLHLPWRPSPHCGHPQRRLQRQPTRVGQHVPAETLPVIAARRAGRWRWPLTRRNCLDASTIPAAHQRSVTWPQNR